MAARQQMDAATNQKHVGTNKGVEEKRFDWGGVQGVVNPIVLALVEVKKMIYNKLNQ